MDLNEIQGEELTLTPDCKLIVPSPSGGKMTFDLTKVLIAEGRLHEVRAVTKAKCAELFSTLNEAWGKAKKIVATLASQEDRCKTTMQELKAVIYLERVPELAKAKGLKETAEIRESLLYTQEDYLKLVHIKDQTVAAIRHMQIKVDEFDRAYFTIKDILKEKDLNFTPNAESPSSAFGRNNY